MDNVWTVRMSIGYTEQIPCKATSHRVATTVDTIMDIPSRYWFLFMTSDQCIHYALKYCNEKSVIALPIELSVAPFERSKQIQ